MRKGKKVRKSSAAYLVQEKTKKREGVRSREAFS